MASITYGEAVGEARVRDARHAYSEGLEELLRDCDMVVVISFTNICEDDCVDV